jgi:hypothetical protein
MAGHPIIQHNKSRLQKWFGPNRNTHWVVAGSVAVILLGSYVVYSNRERGSAVVIAVPAATQAPDTTAPAPPAPVTARP